MAYHDYLILSVIWMCPMKCPICSTPMEYREAEPDVGLAGGYMCPKEGCDGFILDNEIEIDI